MKERITTQVKQSGLYTIGGLVGRATNLVLVPLYTRVFSPDQYGIISLVQITISFLAVFLIAGTDNASGRYYLDTKDERDKKLTASTAMIFRVISVTAGCAVFMFFSKDISQLIFHTDIYSNYLMLAAAALPFLQAATLCRNTLRFNFRATAYTVLSSARIVADVGIIIFFIVYLQRGINGIFEAAIIASALFLAINFSFTRRYFGRVFSAERLKELLKYGVPLIPYGVTIYLIQNCDRYFLSYYQTLEQVGLYSLGLGVASLLILVFTGAGLAWGPFVYSTYKESDIKRVYSRLGDYFVAAAFFMVVALSLFSLQILMVFTTPPYFQAYMVVPILALYFAFYRLGLRMSFGINIAKKTFHFTWISVITAAVNIGLNFLLVPPYGMMGAAFATLACSVVWCVLLIYVSQKLYHVSYNVTAYLKVLGIALGIIAASYFLPQGFSVLGILARIGLLALFTRCLFIFKLIGRDEVVHLKELAFKILLRRK